MSSRKHKSKTLLLSKAKSKTIKKMKNLKKNGKEASKTKVKIKTIIMMNKNRDMSKHQEVNLRKTQIWTCRRNTHQTLLNLPTRSCRVKKLPKRKSQNQSTTRTPTSSTP